MNIHPTRNQRTWLVRAPFIVVPQTHVGPDSLVRAGERSSPGSGQRWNCCCREGVVIFSPTVQTPIAMRVTFAQTSLSLDLLHRSHAGGDDLPRNSRIRTARCVFSRTTNCVYSGLARRPLS